MFNDKNESQDLTNDLSCSKEADGLVEKAKQKYSDELEAV